MPMPVDRGPGSVKLPMAGGSVLMRLRYSIMAPESGRLDRDDGAADLSTAYPQLGPQLNLRRPG